MTSPQTQSLRWIRSAVAAGLALAGIGLSPAVVAMAKQYDIAGTVDCGVRSGHHCDVGDTLQLWTDDLSGSRELATVDISWIRRQVPSLDQDDPIDLEVQDQPDGTIQAIGVADEGSFVDRLNFGVHEEYTTFNGSIRAHVGHARDDDEAMSDKGIRRQEDLHHKK